MSREEKNHRAYMDVLDCAGPSMSDDSEYMEFYRSWYKLGAEARDERWNEMD